MQVPIQIPVGRYPMIRQQLQMILGIIVRLIRVSIIIVGSAAWK